MCTPLLAVAAVAAAGSAAMQGVAASNQADAAQKSADYNAQVAANNALTASEQRSVVLQQGQARSEQSQLQQAQMLGQQKAALAANGMSLNSGSATDILASTQFLGQQDVGAIQSNAAREAWGYSVNQSNDLAQSNLDKWQASAINPTAAGGMAAGSSILSSASMYAGGAAFK
jgi:hypothetical protein